MLQKGSLEQEEDTFIRHQKKGLIFLKKLAEKVKGQEIEGDQCYQVEIDSKDVTITSQSIEYNSQDGFNITDLDLNSSPVTLVKSQ